MSGPNYQASFSPTLRPDRLLRQFGAGFLNTPADVTVGLAGALGSEGAAAAHQGYTDAVNNMLGAPEPYWYADPTAFAARELGSAVVGLPVRAVNWGYRLLSNVPSAVRVAARGLEYATPLTIPLNRTNIAINTGVGSVVGAGLQELDRIEQEANDAGVVIGVDEGGVVVPDADGGVPIPPRQAPEPLVMGEDGGVTLPDVPPQPRAEGPRTWQGMLLQAAPYLAAGGIVLGAGAGIRQGVIANRAAQATPPDPLVQPGSVPNPEVATLTPGQVAAQEAVSEQTGARTVLREAEAAGVLNPLDRMRVEGAMAARLQESARNDIVLEAQRRGEFNGTTFRPREEVELEVAALRNTDPARHVLLREALVAGNELDARQYNFDNNRWRTDPVTGSTLVGEPQRPSLMDKNDVDLQDVWSRGMADPVVGPMMLRYYDDMAAARNLAYNEGLISDVDRIRFAKRNPRYVHFLEDDKNPLAKRDYDEGAHGIRGQDPYISANEVYRRVISQALENSVRKQFAEAVIPYAQRMAATAPNAPRLVRGVKAKVSEDSPRGWETIKWREKGVTKAIEVAPAVATAFRTTPRVVVPFFSAAARVFRSTVTGPLAAVTGTVFAPISALMATGAATVNRPQGFRAGLLDSAAQGLTGGRVGLRGDPTFALNTVFEMGAGLAAESARQFAATLRRSQIMNGPISRMVSPTTLNQWIASAQKAYDNSNLAFMRERGMAGTGLARDPELARTNLVENAALTPELRLAVESGNHKHAVRTLYDRMRSVGIQATPTQAVHIWRYYTTALDIISGSATGAFVRQNRKAFAGNEDALAGVARGITGDPADMGGNRWIQGILSTIPYSNVAIQSTAAYVRAFRNNFPAAVTGVAMATTIPVMLELASAILADELEGPEGQGRHLAYVVNKSGAGQYNDVTIHVPGFEPSNGMRIVSDLTMAPVLAFTGNLALQALYATDPSRFYAPELAPLRNAWVEFMSDRMDRGISAGLAGSVLQVSPPPLIPSAIYAVSEATGTGVDVRPLFNFTNSRLPNPRDRGAPGFTETRLFDSPVPTYVSAIGEMLFGAAYANAERMVQTGIRASRAEDAQVIAALADQWGLNNARSSAILPPLLQSPRALVQTNVIAEALRPIEGGLENAARNFRGEVLLPGMVGAGRALQSPIGDGRPGVSPEMEQVLTAMRIEYNRPDMRLLRERRSALQQQLVGIESNAAFNNDPVTRLQAMNQVVRQIQALNAEMYFNYTSAELALSVRLGRKIRFDNVDPQRGLDQFPSLR